MDFRLSDDQRALRRGVRELLAGRFGREALRAAVDREGGLDRKLWRELGDAGFFALRLPEDEGGAGLGLPEAVLVFEEVGRVLLPGPLVATHLAAGSVPGAADGTAVVTAASELPSLVQHFEDADTVVVFASDGVPHRVDVPEAEAVPSLDPLTPLHRLPRPPLTPGPPPGAAVLLTAAEQLGSAARSTEEAVRHAKSRVQFGRPVGGFQAVGHLCAEMLVRTETARAAVYAAAVGGDLTEIAGAKLLADEAAVRGARDCLQVFGGMGFTWESDVHLHLKRALLRARRWLTTARAEEIQAQALASAF
ncbi:acyl-CoA dehydrogenase family protein [Streptomyces pristinaespiralis]|uniref:Acyl-CoA dehydrogenase n=2 Tax=Streptomyces pristinaespiralis TaxID=38300 RepID=B5HJR7_STRE2|nr:acyl-CoA dehydrogenase family protein [Streptomyces pristinaespiralis]ALC22553.1 acyl-CoA dehydrogenase [Streptomyces pristinaespiralis]EDY67078.1 acyl-CoA dehydrogenase [Streptomyces pristinaespiralis ATCC 25486]QMU14862.1 acyl-CoA/acyl-ACP dehydrogenase [Streptomyces pristinaespiralis]